MLCFPQISTGVVAQYPIVKRVSRRVVSNRMLGGEVIKAADPDAYRVAWDLRYSGLNDTERSMLEDFYKSVEGRLRTFLFLDPAGNLLKWSVDLSKDVWQRDPLVQITGNRVVNTAQAQQGVHQVVSVPGSLHYVWSAYVRADVSTRILFSIGACSTAVDLEDRWQRVICTGVPGGDAEVSCRFEVAPGAAIDVRDLQFEAQRFPSGYRATAQASGAYAGTRFDQDRLIFTANGIHDHSVNIRLVSRAGA